MRDRLYRSRRVKVLGGVAGGLAQYFNIDPIIVRILFVVFTLMHGMGLVLYIILWIVVPEEPFELAYPIMNDETKTDGQSTETSSVNFDGVPAEEENGSGRVIAGNFNYARCDIFCRPFYSSFDFRDSSDCICCSKFINLNSLKSNGEMK